MRNQTAGTAVTKISTTNKRSVTKAALMQQLGRERSYCRDHGKPAPSHGLPQQKHGLHNAGEQRRVRTAGKATR